MRLKRIELENVCQHQHLEHVWHPGLNGIVGPNGSGKSNIIKATRFAITGQFDNAGVKAENIFQLAGDKARSRVLLDFEHDGLLVEVVRVLRRGTSRCRIYGGDWVDGDNAVTETIMDLLGVDQRVLSEYIFVPQRRMAGFVDETPGERNKTFGQLFDLRGPDVIYRLLEAEVKRVNPAPPSPEIGPMRVRVARNLARRDELQAAIVEARFQLKGFDRARARGLVDRAERWEKSQRTLDDNAAAVVRLKDDLEGRRGELAGASAERDDLVRALDEASGDVAAAREALDRWEVIQARRKWRDNLQARQEALEAEPAGHPEPQPPKTHLGEAAVQIRVAELSHAIRTRKDLLALFRNKPRVCPTCGAETDAILAKAAAYEEELPAMERDYAEAVRVQHAYARHVNERAQWESWFRAHERRGADLAREWQDLAAGVEEAAGADRDACRGMVDAGDALAKAIGEAGARTDQLRQEVDRWVVMVAEADEKMARFRRELGESPDPGAVATARGDLARVEQMTHELFRNEGELQGVAAALADDEALLERLEEAEARAEADRLWAYHLGEVRKVMHHDRLPKVVAHNYLEILADDTNDLLEAFDADFRVGLGEGLDFAATFIRGPYAGAVSPAQRLSEGQKVLLALAFRVAVNSLFAGTAGLLCLDEPTESLDERNLACLEVAIGKMRDLAESRGLQCLLVTHEPSFEVLFDGVLRLVA